MANIFVSYAREDRDRVQPFVEILEQQGWSVWWDRELSPGQHFERIIDNEIDEADCVVVFWSKYSVESEWVLAEAHEGMQRGVLIPILLDEVRVPLIFRQKQSAFLVDWPDQIDESELERVIGAIAELLASPRSDIRLDGVVASQRKKKFRAAGLALGSVVLLYLAFSQFTSTRDDIQSPQEAISELLAEVETELPEITVAVLPFETDDEAWDAYSAELQDLLEGISDFYLSPEEQVQAYQAGDESARLDSRYVISGEVSETGVKPMIRVRLYDQQEQRTVWEDEIASEQENPLASARLMASQIASQLNQNIDAQTEEIPEEVYLQYLKAKAAARQPASLENLEITHELYEQVVDAAPRYAEARAGLCQADLSLYVETKEPNWFEEAEKHCYRAYTLASDNLHVLTAMGELQVRAGQFDQADDYFLQALTISPYATDIMRSRARNLSAQGKFEEAEELLLSATALEPNYWRNYQDLGSIYFNTGDYEKAAIFFGRQSELVLEKGRALANVGAAYYLLEAFDLAIDNWNQSLMEQPSATTHANLGAAYFFNHQYSRAAESYEAALELSPSNHELWGNLGEALMHGNADYEAAFEKAITLAESETSINPNNTEALSGLASYYAAVGNELESLKNLDKVLTVAEDDVYTAYDVAVSYARLQNGAEKQAWLDKLVAMGYSKSLINRDANFK